jgi:hypothetical protein
LVRRRFPFARCVKQQGRREPDNLVALPAIVSVYGSFAERPIQKSD